MSIKERIMKMTKKQAKGQALARLQEVAEQITPDWAVIEEAYGCEGIYCISKENDPKHFAIATLEDGAVTPYELDGYGAFNGCIHVSRDGKAGILSVHQGMVYIAPNYDSVFAPIDDWAEFEKDGKVGYVTFDGRFIAKEEFDAMSDDEQDAVYDAGLICGTDYSTTL
jgi:hypothetical protein